MHSKILFSFLDARCANPINKCHIVCFCKYDDRMIKNNNLIYEIPA